MKISENSFETYNEILADSSSILWMDEILSDTANWTLLEGYYLANGGEQYVTIGRLTPYNKHSFIKLSETATWPFEPYAYYFIDDVFVEEGKPQTRVDTVCAGDTVKRRSLYINAPFYWSRTGTDTLSTDKYFISIPPWNDTVLLIGPQWADTFITIVMPTGNVSIQAPPLLCAGDEISISANGSPQPLQWSTGINGNGIRTTEGGMYKVRTFGLCPAWDSVLVLQHPKPEPLLSTLISHCFEDDLLTLFAGNASKYLWQPDGHEGSELIISRPGTYSVWMQNEAGCTDSAAVVVRDSCATFVQFPNSFSPNGDGLNDVFTPVASRMAHWQLSIWNRWGGRIANLENQGWDGTHEGMPAPIGVYLYLFEGTALSGEPVSLRGMVHLIR